MNSLGIGLNHTDELVGFLVDVFLNANLVGTQLNVISNQLISDALYTLTQHRITSGNLWYYKLNGFDMTALVSKGLAVPILNTARCNIAATNQNLTLMPMSDGPIECFNNLLEKCTKCSIKPMYEIWKDSGRDVGDKRNWPSSELVDWCQKHKIVPVVPISHDQPTKLRRVFRQMISIIQKVDAECPEDMSMNMWLNEKLLAFCNADLNCDSSRKPNWLPLYPNLPKVRYVESLNACDRRNPYLYCRQLNGNCKIGMAENSDRFSASDVGVVIGLKSDNELSTLDTEQLLLQKLKERHILPIPGKKEHFAAPLRSLASVILDICSTTPAINSKIRTIVATTQYRK